MNLLMWKHSVLMLKNNGILEDCASKEAGETGDEIRAGRHRNEENKDAQKEHKKKMKG